MTLPANMCMALLPFSDSSKRTCAWIWRASKIRSRRALHILCNRTLLSAPFLAWWIQKILDQKLSSSRKECPQFLTNSAMAQQFFSRSVRPIRLQRRADSPQMRSINTVRCSLYMLIRCCAKRWYERHAAPTQCPEGYFKTESLSDRLFFKAITRPSQK